jgi:hypothetical protein
MIERVIWGLGVATVGAAGVLWLLIDQLAWGYLERKNVKGKGKGKAFTMPLGVVERLLYVAAIIAGEGSWVGVWLGAKVAVSWRRWSEADRAIYNVFLIGNALSILFAVLGAWIVLGHFPRLSD